MKITEDTDIEMVLSNNREKILKKLKDILCEAITNRSNEWEKKTYSKTNYVSPKIILSKNNVTFYITIYTEKSVIKKNWFFKKIRCVDRVSVLAKIRGEDIPEKGYIVDGNPYNIELNKCLNDKEERLVKNIICFINDKKNLISQARIISAISLIKKEMLIEKKH